MENLTGYCLFVLQCRSVLKRIVLRNQTEWNRCCCYLTAVYSILTGWQWKKILGRQIRAEFVDMTGYRMDNRL